MNWLGSLIKPYVNKKDTVLDLGCGIMQATTNLSYPLSKNLKCKLILGVDIHIPYLDKIKKRYPTINTNVNNTKIFIDKSYDVVLCLDVLEHLVEKDALNLITEMERIARKFVIIYTPKEFHKNEEHIENVWGMGDNPHQEHLCLITQKKFIELGYEVSTTKIDNNTLAIKKII